MEVKVINKATFTIDPTDVYKDYTACLYQCGILLDFLAEAAETETSLEKALEEGYQYFMNWRCDEGMVVNDFFCYPGDPEQAPVLKVVQGDETAYIFRHGIVAIVKDNTTKWTRMD